MLRGDPDGRAALSRSRRWLHFRADRRCCPWFRKPRFSGCRCAHCELTSTGTQHPAGAGGTGDGISKNPAAGHGKAAAVVGEIDAPRAAARAALCADSLVSGDDAAGHGEEAYIITIRPHNIHRAAVIVICAGDFASFTCAAVHNGQTAALDADNAAPSGCRRQTSVNRLAVGDEDTAAT